jgi:RNA polymerase sigma-70 factor (ECF subfamily)
MPDDTPFPELMRRVRAGDQAAAAELVRQYEPEIRRAVRVRLTDLHLRRLFDSLDICQSVLANFFVRATAGRFDLDRPGQLLRLLVTMARNKVIDKWRSHRKELQKADAGGANQLVGVAAGEPAPGGSVDLRDQVEQLRGRLTDEERYLADQWQSGRTWADLATELGTTPEALRKKHSRAIDQAARQLEL